MSDDKKVEVNWETAKAAVLLRYAEAGVKEWKSLAGQGQSRIDYQVFDRPSPSGGRKALGCPQDTPELAWINAHYNLAASPEPKPVSDDVVYSVEEKQQAADEYSGRLMQTCNAEERIRLDCGDTVRISEAALELQCALNRAESRLAAQGREIEEAREMIEYAHQGHYPHDKDMAAWLTRNQPQEVKDGK